MFLRSNDLSGSKNKQGFLTVFDFSMGIQHKDLSICLSQRHKKCQYLIKRAIQTICDTLKRATRYKSNSVQ